MKFIFHILSHVMVYNECNGIILADLPVWLFLHQFDILCDDLEVLEDSSSVSNILSLSNCFIAGISSM